MDDGAGEGQDLSGICSELSPSDTAHSIVLRKPGSGQKEGRWKCPGARGDSATQGDKEQPLILEGRPGREGTACTSRSASISGQTGHVPLWVSFSPGGY